MSPSEAQARLQRISPDRMLQRGILLTLSIIETSDLNETSPPPPLGSFLAAFAYLSAF